MTTPNMSLTSPRPQTVVSGAVSHNYLREAAFSSIILLLYSCDLYSSDNFSYFLSKNLENFAKEKLKLPCSLEELIAS